MTAPLQFVQLYHERGWTVIPLHPRTKRPMDSAWQNPTRSNHDVEALFRLNPTLNIGWLIQDGWVDIDLDTQAAIRLAPSYLPRTDAVFGRLSKQSSHWLFEVNGPISYVKYVDPSIDPYSSADGRPQRSKTLLEIRNVGHQTALPGSVHESGERVEWRRFGVIPKIEATDLVRATAHLAAAVTLSQIWPEGTRHDTTMALTGALHRAGWSKEQIWEFLEPVLFEAGDIETEDRQRAVNDTIDNFATRPVTGWPTLERLTHSASVKQIRTWLLGRAVGRRDMTDQGNAQRLFDYFSEQLRYCPGQKAWYVWDGRRWSEDEDQVKAEHCAVQVTDLMLERELPALREEGSEDAIKAFFKHILASRSAGRIHAAVNQARALPEFQVSTDELDQDPYLLNCRNGTLDLLTGALKRHDPADYITKMAGTDWRPQARHPDWERFLLRATEEDTAMLDYLQRLAGYSLFFGNPAERFVMVHGPAGSGKSTFVEVLGETLGDYVATLDPSSLKAEGNANQSRDDLVNLRGARMVRTTELDEGAQWSAALVKRLTGGDTIQARRLYQRTISFMPGFLMFLSTNSKPRVRDSSSGYWRRLISVPFTHVVGADEYDEELKHRMRTGAREAVLAWAFRGFQDYHRDGLGEVPGRIQEANDAYRDEMDPIAQFLDEAVQIGEDHREKSGALYNAYRDWCRNMNHRAMAAGAFKAAVEHRGFAWMRTNQGSVYRGLRLQPLLEFTQNSDPFAGRPAENNRRN